jgi:hypothetical protein
LLALSAPVKHNPDSMLGQLCAQSIGDHVSPATTMGYIGEEMRRSVPKKTHGVSGVDAYWGSSEQMVMAAACYDLDQVVSWAKAALTELSAWQECRARIVEMRVLAESVGLDLRVRGWQDAAGDSDIGVGVM